MYFKNLNKNFFFKKPDYPIAGILQEKVFALDAQFEAKDDKKHKIDMANTNPLLKCTTQTIFHLLALGFVLGHDASHWLHKAF